MEVNNTKLEDLGDASDVHVFNISSTNLLHVGYAPDLNGLPGCVHDMSLNGQKIGFWNFEDSFNDCTGCVRKSTYTTTNDVRFNGNGYSLIRQARQYKVADPTKVLVSFWLKTFDENALLFLAPHPDKAYISLSLQDGYVEYEVRYRTDIAPIKIKSAEKYNNGKKIQIIMAKEYDISKSVDKASLTVRGEDVGEEKLTEERTVSRKDILKVKKVNYYFGGVPPDFHIDCAGCAQSSNTYDSLLGDIYDCSVFPVQILLYDTNKDQQHYGVQLQQGELEFRKAWFQGQGHLQLNPIQLRSHFKIAFVIRTSDSNSLVMSISKIGKFIIIDGKIEVDVYGSKKNVTLLSSLQINDDQHHLIELIKTSKDYILKIDGKKEKSRKHGDHASEVSAKFYVGGLVDESADRFAGEISDVIVDDQLIKFNVQTLDGFSKVKIGHSMPKKKWELSNEVIGNENLRSRGAIDSIKEMQSTESCDQSKNYSLEPNAAKFGDAPESYVKYYLKESFWKEDFIVELEFRTFYKNGMLLFSQGDKGHYNLLELKEGVIQLHVVGKRKKTLILSKKVDDGSWHRILLRNKAIRKRRKLLFSLDGMKEKLKKIPQNKVSGDVFIGTIPTFIQPRLPKTVISKLHPFRGCVRELRLNNEPQGFVNHHQIGQCFPNIEKGSYFRGDAYAIYNKYFKVSKHLELNFEFRTTQQNGILMSVSTRQNSPALSLELQNGAVVMSVDMGNGVISNVTNYLSEYALCNNRWHNVAALFSTELTVSVDGVSKSWVISEGGQMEDIEDPLYIGGLPDYAAGGTLKIRENFKGCIRNIKIGENFVDWINMEELNNISLNSCPVV